MDILALKKKHNKIICVSFMGMTICFKLLPWKEYKDYFKLLSLGLVNQVDLYDQVFKDCVFNEDLIDKMYSMPAGLVDSISGLIFHLSGNPLNNDEDIQSLNQSIDEIRNVVQSNIYEQYIILICKAFPSYTPHDLDKLDWQEFLRILLLAEAKLKLPSNQISAVAEGHFISRQWPDEANVNITKPKEEKKNRPRTLSEQIKQDTRKLMREDPNLATEGKQVLSEEELAALKAYRQKEEMNRKRAGRERKRAIQHEQRRMIQEREERRAHQAQALEIAKQRRAQK